LAIFGVSENTHAMDQNNDEQSPPPFLKSWRNIYLLVLANLAVLIILFYLFTKAYQ